MGRLIDASVLQEEYKRQHDGKRLLLIDVAPTVDAVPVRYGRWKMVEGELAFWDMCSVCGRKILHRTPYYDFCPNCGADMRGEQDG